MGHFQVGSSIGNGHPIGAVIATKEIAKSMDGYYSTFGGNPVACTMGTAVLRVLINERLLAAANNVGFILESLFKSIKVSPLSQKSVCRPTLKLFAPQWFSLFNYS